MVADMILHNYDSEAHSMNGYRSMEGFGDQLHAYCNPKVRAKQESQLSYTRRYFFAM